MMSGAAVGAIVYILLASCLLVLLVALFIAPLKLYGIHREIRYTNELLKHQSELLKWQGDRLARLIAEQGRAQAGAAGGSPSLNVDDPEPAQLDSRPRPAPKTCSFCGVQTLGDEEKCARCGQPFSWTRGF